MTANVVSTQPATARTDTPTRRQPLKHRGSAGRLADGRTRPMTAEELFTLPKGRCNTSLCGGSYGRCRWRVGSMAGLR